MRGGRRVVFAAGLLAGAAAGPWWPWWPVFILAGLAAVIWAARGDPWLRARMLIGLAACRATRLAGGGQLTGRERTMVDVQEQVALAVLEARTRAERAEVLAVGAEFLAAVRDGQ